jgi:ACS family glucarate transporter-like MFS transporter
MGETVSFTASNKTVRQWFPAEERGIATGIYHAAGYVGVALVSPLVAWIVLRAGWRTSFVVFGGVGFVWLACWLKWFQSPEQCSWLSLEERQYIVATRDGGAVKTADPRDNARQIGFVHSLAPLLRQKSMWGLFLGLGCLSYTNYLFLAWLPSYLVQARGMDLMKAGIYTGIPYLIAALAEMILGRVSDRVLTPDALKQGKRRNHVALLLLLSSVVLLINVVNSSFTIIVIITVVLTCNTTATTFIYALTNDLIEVPRVAGTVFGVSNLGGQVFGLIAPVVTGYVVKMTGRFDSAFVISAAVTLIGVVVTLTMTRRPIQSQAPASV